MVNTRNMFANVSTNGAWLHESIPMTDPTTVSGPVTTSLSHFCLRVYAALMTVPRGRVTTYGALARAIGCRSARAIGGALRKNPFDPRIPCHRVIAADGTPGGYKGRRNGEAITEKTTLLASEGVLFHNGRLADRGCLYEPQHPPSAIRTEDTV